MKVSACYCQMFNLKGPPSDSFSSKHFLVNTIALKIKFMLLILMIDRTISKMNPTDFEQSWTLSKCGLLEPMLEFFLIIFWIADRCTVQLLNT